MSYDQLYVYSVIFVLDDGCHMEGFPIFTTAEGAELAAQEAVEDGIDFGGRKAASVFKIKARPLLTRTRLP